MVMLMWILKVTGFSNQINALKQYLNVSTIIFYAYLWHDYFYFKGLVGNVTLSGHVLKRWTMYGMPLNQTSLLDKMVYTVATMKSIDSRFAKEIAMGLTKTQGEANFWHGELDINCTKGNRAKDTFLRLDGWTKGVAFMNGFNLGRYWPVMGPQVIT